MGQNMTQARIHASDHPPHPPVEVPVEPPPTQEPPSREFPNDEPPDREIPIEAPPPGPTEPTRA
jgi:hypothetical protein